MWIIGMAPGNFKGSQTSYYKEYSFPMKADGFTNDIKQAKRFPTMDEAENMMSKLNGSFENVNPKPTLMVLKDITRF